MPDLPAFNDGPIVGTFTPLAPGSSEVNGPGTLASVDQFLVGAQAELTAAATSVQQIGEQVEADAAAAVQAAIGQFQADQEQLQALADILVPSGATATFRDSDNLMLLGDML